MMFDDFAIARALHVLALVHWIGGVAMVTTIVLPRASAMTDAHMALTAFEVFEDRFAAQARGSILIAGLSGFYMLEKSQAWERLIDPAFWWLWLMVAVWAIFALMVFVLNHRSSIAYFVTTLCATRIAPSHSRSGYTRLCSRLQGWPF